MKESVGLWKQRGRVELIYVRLYLLYPQSGINTSEKEVVSELRKKESKMSVTFVNMGCRLYTGISFQELQIGICFGRRAHLCELFICTMAIYQSVEVW